MMELFKETILSAVIIQLASFTNISVPNFFCKYKELFHNYGNEQAIKNLLEDSLPEENWKIIQKAKILALGDVDLTEKNEEYRPLCSIFSNLSIDGSYPKKSYYAPAKLSVEKTIPLAYYKAEWIDIQKVKDQFCQEIDLLSQTPPADFDAFLIVMDTLMKKYLWGIPATGREDEDISLYDYIKAVIAIATVLLKTDSEHGENPFVVAAGHFSGIQKYIFSVAKVGAGGVAKRLRSRSFFVNAVISALAHSIIHKFEMPISNILMLTGGKFYILLPNSKHLDSMLDETEAKTMEFLYGRFKGNLSFELVWEKVSCEDISRYNETLVRLSAALDVKKNQFLKSVLVKDGKWDFDKFVVYHDLFHKSMCKACRSALVDEGKEMCSNCEIDTEIGGKLPKIRQYSFSRKKGQYELLEGYYLNLDIGFAEKENYLIMNINHSDISGLYDKPVSVTYAVNNVPVKKFGSDALNVADIKTFSEIAQESRGCKNIGILKADVDTLGFIFSDGMKREDTDALPIARVSALSRMLDLFFNGCLYEIIKSKYPNIYCVFAGGDDLFLIGPWSEMPALAIEINKKFDEYTGHNKCMTLSAVICSADGNKHISTLAEYCEKKLTQVKNESNQIINPDKNGRNGIYFLGEIMSWTDFEKQVGVGEKFSKAYSNVGVAIFRRLGKYSLMYQKYLNSRNIDSLMFLPMFSYDMMRNYDDIKNENWFKSYCTKLYKNVSNYRGCIEKEFYYTNFSIQYALNLTREERKYE